MGIRRRHSLHRSFSKWDNSCDVRLLCRAINNGASGSSRFPRVRCRAIPPEVASDCEMDLISKVFVSWLYTTWVGKSREQRSSYSEIHVISAVTSDSPDESEMIRNNAIGQRLNVIPKENGRLASKLLSQIQVHRCSENPSERTKHEAYRAESYADSIGG